jgi:hypothetical protein
MTDISVRWCDAESSKLRLSGYSEFVLYQRAVVKPSGIEYDWHLEGLPAVLTVDSYDFTQSVQSNTS